MSQRKVEAVLFWAQKDRFTIGECERLAKDLDAYDSMTFELVGPTGRLSAKWLDAYSGLFEIAVAAPCPPSSLNTSPTFTAKTWSGRAIVDRYREADETRSGSVGEAATAGAAESRIAQTSPGDPT